MVSSCKMATVSPMGFHLLIHTRLRLASVDETKERKDYEELKDSGTGAA